MAACVCGYTHAHIPHTCWRDDVKPHTRCEVKPRCKCGFLHAHIPHDCSSFPEKPKAPAEVFDEEPATIKVALAQWAKGWRPKEMCTACTSLDTPCLACWKRAGFLERDYEHRFREAPRVQPVPGSSSTVDSDIPDDVA